MRRIRLFALGIVSFVAALMGALLAPGTFVNRALSAALCTVFSFNSTICTVNLVNWSDRVVAATPPAVERNISDWLVQRAPGEFDDAPSVPPGSNPQAPPFPQDPGPNLPVRPDFDNRQQSVNPSGKEFQSRNIKVRELRNKTYEVTHTTSEDCQVTRVINALSARPYVESIKLDPVNPNTCKTGFYLFLFQPDGSQIEIRSTTEGSLILKFSSRDNTRVISQVIYRDKSGKEEVYEVPSNKQKTQKNTQNLGIDRNYREVDNNKIENDLFSINPAYLVADSNGIIGDLSCGTCKSLKTAWDLTFGPSVPDLLPTKAEDRPEYFGGAGFVDDLLGLLDVGVASGGMFLINQFMGSFTAINNAINKTKQIGIECKNISVGDQSFNCDKSDYNPDADRVITEGCTVCTCCVYTAQYKYSHNGQVSGGTFNAPCKGSIEQIVAKINSDLARDIARRQLPYIATVVGTPQRNTEPPPECDGSLQTAPQPQQTAPVVTARISQVDDVARIYVDGKIVFEGFYAPGGKGGDTGWQPINVGSGGHQVRLVVENTQSGESGGWFEIKINGELKINQGRPFQKDRITGIKYDQTTTLEVP
ncbi:MAG: hypothetical protein EAZ78_08155 [Oscillatoriales cyanobacterium]|uniref:hypothetical protein n=1 Tax=Microcoleus anatoxicus TaxID=2705319 RepID=UPI0029709267|nr:MAG: hypothetical protein EAZ78_08155 [Oscillatoriales cyanobacterium]TAF63682.1 MAG: hypothetical protein EAZ59_20365 [Oscillatoriales cyanobacterium]